MKKNGQVALEYIVILGFVMITLMGILTIAFFYGEAIEDRLKIIQIQNFANKIISSSETVFYSGEPSKATINSYLPKGVENIQINNNEVIMTIQLSTGNSKISYSSNVPLSGSITTSPGLKKIKIEAIGNSVTISQP